MTDSALQQLVDRQEIVDVMSRYARGIDRRDAQLYRSCFTDVIDVEMPGAQRPATSADSWVEHALGVVTAFESTQHIITNHVIEIDHDEARCTAYVQAQHWRPESAWLVGGQYRNELVRIDGEWRIRHLELVFAWTERTGKR